MNESKCPYCGHEYEIEPDGCTEFEEQCPNCEKYFEVVIEYSPALTITKID